MTAASIAPPEGGNPRLAAFVGEGDDISIYRAMLLIRRFEEKAGQLFGMGLIGGFCHLYIGQEAVVVGMRLAAGETDQFIASYRHHGHLLACGADPRAVMAEMTGRRGGAFRRQGRLDAHVRAGMRLFRRPRHRRRPGFARNGAGLRQCLSRRRARLRVLLRRRRGGSGPGRGKLQHGGALAPADRLCHREQPRPAGGAGDGPASLAQRGAAFDIPGETVDGMCVEAVREAGARAIARARSGAGPSILEMRTERYRGHSLADPAKYRRKDEARAAPAPDPVERAREKILRAGLAEEADLKRLDAEVRAIVVAAAEYAAQSPEPDASELEKDVLL